MCKSHGFWGNHAEDRMCQNSSVVCTFHSLLNVQKIAVIIHFDTGSIVVCGEIGSKGWTVWWTVLVWCRVSYVGLIEHLEGIFLFGKLNDP